jgi:hypothetical protein
MKSNSLLKHLAVSSVKGRRHRSTPLFAKREMQDRPNGDAGIDCGMREIIFNRFSRDVPTQNRILSPLTSGLPIQFPQLFYLASTG